MQFSGTVLSPSEAELLVRQLRCIPIAEVGSDPWKSQREAVERLNMCTHSNAVQRTDDYVKSFLLEHERLSDLLHELLVMEVWRQRVLPLVKDAVADNPTAPYMFCSYEVVLLNLLECICFYEEVVVGFGDDVLELIDYCWRQVYRLFSLPASSPSSSAASAASGAASVDQLLRETPAQRLDRQLSDATVTRAMSCLSLLWFVIDRLDELPLAASSSVLQTHDLPAGLAEVVVRQPWLRRTPGTGAAQKYQNGAFVDVAGDEVLRVCTPEAHTWFCLHKLLCDPECRKQYLYTQHKKEMILRVRRFLNDTLVDQIPALASVQRALEELSFLEPPSGTEEKFKTRLIIQQVPRIMSTIDSDRADWKGQATRLEQKLRDPGEKVKDAMRMASIFDQMFAGS